MQFRHKWLEAGRTNSWFYIKVYQL